MVWINKDVNKKSRPKMLPYSLSSPHQNSPTQLHGVKTHNSNYRHCRDGERVSTPFISICHNRKFRKQYRLPVHLMTS